MSTPQTDLTDAEFAELDELLATTPEPLQPLDASMLDGYLCGVLVQPRMIDIEEWLPNIFDYDVAPDTAGWHGARHERLLALVQRRFDALNRQMVEDGWFDPVVLDLEAETDEDESAESGAEDQFFNRFAGLATMLPVMPVVRGETKFQPVYVGDVADAVMAALARDDSRGRIYELGGPRAMSMRQVLQFVLEHTRRCRPLVPLPEGLVRFQARLGEMLPTPPLTRDQLILLGKDNLVAEGAAGFAALGIEPKAVEAIVPAYLARYRAGGSRRDGR